MDFNKEKTPPLLTKCNNNTPPHLKKLANIATLDLLPEKSQKIYLQVYHNFIIWQKKENTTSFSETVLLSYFLGLSKQYAPSTLWSKYSMLKATISLKHNIDINKYSNLQSFLKKKSTGFQSVQSKVFSPEEISSFLQNAPNELYLATKVVTIFGIFGACRGDELHKLKIDDITDIPDSKLLKVNIPDSKTHKKRNFFIENEYYEIVKTYINLRPKNITTKNIFINFQRGKCSNQNIGIHKIHGMSKEIAKFLNLLEPERYTGHSFRRSAATTIVDNGADLTILKRFGGWKSSTVAERYIEESDSNKKQISNILSRVIKVNKPTEELISNSEEKEVSTEIYSDDSNQNNAKKIKYNPENEQIFTSKTQMYIII